MVTVTPRGFTTAAAAVYLGVSKNTLEYWRAQGTGPAYRKLSQGPKARTVYLREDLDAWLEALPLVESSDVMAMPGSQG